MGAEAENVTVRLTGFAPNEMLTLKTQTDTEEASIDHPTDKHGDWTGVVKLQVNGRHQGFC